MDMNRALKESNKAEIASRLITEMEEFKNDEDIIDKCVNWIMATYGMTKYEEQCVVGKKFLNLRRDPSKDVQKFIAEFDAIMKESEAVGLILPDNWKAIILQIAAGLTKSEKNNVATMVNMDSKLEDCYMQMKSAIRKIGHRTEKESDEVLLAEDEWIEDTVDDILSGERRLNGNGRPRFQNQGYQNQQRGFRDGQDRGQRQYRNDYRNDRQQQGSREGGYRNYQSKGLVQRIEELNPQSRKDVLDELKRKFDELNTDSTAV
jgi:hypothetical protein